MSYLSGFIVPVPTNKRDAYVTMSRDAAEIFMEYGALRVVECWGDDVPEGKVTDFHGAVKAEPGETVVFSWIEWPDKETCKAAEKTMMSDERMQPSADMPFDGKRMIWGGFVPFVDQVREA